MPSPTDFNVSPYYDDFTESKKFHRILFRPAFAVQARELTQVQTQLQNQIERVSDHLFDKGAMIIPGEIGYDLKYYAVKLTSKSASSLSTYVGTTLTGGTSGVTAKVINSVATDGTDPDTLFVKYFNTNSTDNTTITFSDGETLTSSNGATAVVNTTATGSAAQIKEGVYYINGFHVQVSNQTLILDKYTNTPSYRVGLTVTESFVSPGDDSSLNDNAQSVSNTNAPGAHRFKIELTLAKKTLASTEDSNFYELLRLSNGTLQNQVRSTEYAVLEDTLARRTYDESGDYVVKPFDIDIREHLISGSNRGIYTSANGGSSTKLAVGFSPGKAYVKGYEIDTIATTYIDVDKARDYATQNNFSTRFDIGNYVNVTNVYGSPDIVSASGIEPFKGLTLHNLATSSRGTANTGSNSSISTIGRAKTRGFEYSTGTASANIFSSSSLTSAIYKHYLFDIVLFTHLNIKTAQSFTTGEIVTGGTSGATGVVQTHSITESATITGITQADPAVVTANNSFKEGQQVTISSVSGMTEVNSNVYTVRNPSGTTFELYDTDGITSIDSSAFTTYTSGGTAAHGVVIVSNVQGIFQAGETITGGTSANTAVIQSDAVGLKGVTPFDLPSVKQIAMAGSPTFTADTALDATNGDNFVLTGSIDVGSGSADVQGINTRFTEELKVGDSISFTNDSGNTETKIVEAIISNSSLTLSSVTAAASTKTIVTRRRAKSQSPEKNVSIFKLPYTNIKTLKTTANSNASDTTYTFRKHEIKTLTGDGVATFSAGVNETFADLLENDFTISITALGSGGTGAVGDVLSLTGNNHEGSAIFSLNGAKTILTIDFGANYASHDIKALLTLNKTIGSKTKSLTTGSTVAISSQATIESGTIGLAKADVYKINAVYMAADFSTAATSSDTNITSRFDLDNGQRDNFYDIGRIKLKSGEVTPTGRLLVDFDYFTHSSGDYFDVDSYSGVIDYEDIPSYTSSTTGVRYELRDSLDFRPRVDDASTIDSGVQDRSFDGTGASVVQPIKFNSDIRSDFEYYLGRVDKIFLDKDGNFKVLKGASSLNPKIPGALDNAMHLYTLFLPAYTIDTADVGVEHVDNKRYTMRDIGRIENRINTIEYYTQLSLLETAAQNLQIQDANGFDRFKNGFVVDNFTGHNIGDVGNKDYKVSIDYAKGEMRPTFHEDAIQLIERASDGTAIEAVDRTNSNYQKTGDLITLPYTETTLIDQPYASKAINVNPFGVFTWIGSIELTPPGDEWKETERAPELVINNPNGSWDNLTKQSGNSGQLSEFPMSTVWNSWQDTWTGRPIETERQQVGTYETRGGHGWRVIAREEVTTAQQVSQTRTGIRAVAIPETIRTSIGDRVVSVAFVPFIRSRTLTFTATRLKPNTRVYPFFDNINIASYVTPDGGSLGGNLVTDANGSVTGTFAIPDPKVDSNPRWRTGQRLFRLTSSSSNSLTNANVETAANVEYVARGLLETVRETILSSREARVEMRSVTETQNITRTSTRTEERQVGYHDPLAQTFMIDDQGGVFLTSIDLFFSTKDSAIPVTVQIRNVVNGYPGQKILPFSEVTLNPGSVSTSTDGTTATKFTFLSPVYIQNNIEYCFVVMANSQDYNAYVARIGETSLDSNRTISAQPYAGVLFKSQNGMTWSAEQNEDMKFKLRRAEFSQVTGTVTLTNDTLPTRTLKNNPLRTTNGSGVIRVFHPNHGMYGTNNNVTIAGVASGTYNGIAHSDINGTYTSISNVTLDSYDITTAGTATATGDIGSTTVTATQNRVFDVLNLGGIQTMVIPGTKIDQYIRTSTGKSIHGSETQFSLTSAANKLAVVNNDNLFFSAPQMVASEINESGDTVLGISANGSGKSFYTILELTTTNTKISPVLDTQRMSAFTISNRLNSPTSGNTPDYLDDTNNLGTSSAAVYCTKPIILENNSKALDIRLTANIRTTSEVEMYYRVSGPDEERQLEDLSWTPFNTDGSPDTTITPAEDDTTFREYKYSASDIHDFTSFQLKIVMKGTNSSYPPILRDMRGIALAV
jgi:hypothetical protein